MLAKLSLGLDDAELEKLEAALPPVIQTGQDQVSCFPPCNTYRTVPGKLLSPYNTDRKGPGKLLSSSAPARSLKTSLYGF